MNITVIILAAGKGKRMQTKLPKVLHSIASITLLEHLLITVNSMNISDIRVISNDILEGEAEFQSLRTKYDFKSFIQSEQLGTANAVMCGFEQDITTSYVLILYGDCPLIESDTLDDMHIKAQDSALCLLGFKAVDPSGYGRLIVNGDTVVKIVEDKDTSHEQAQIDLCNSGIMMVRNDLIQSFLSKINNANESKEYYLTDIVEIANTQGYKCRHVIANESEVLGINTLTQLAVAEEIFQNKLRQEFLSKGVMLVAPHTNFFSHDTKIVSGVKIYPYVFFGPNVIIEEGCEIYSFSHIEGAHIGKNCTIGPSARLRSGTVLKDNVKVGNFVEIKKSTLGHATKASHLSYIGDANVGNDCNIGAGAIFCNYDGKNKHSTNVADNAFIGSNSSLIAPLNIGANSIIAAGSVITDNIKPNRLAIARSRQINKVRKK